MKRISLLISIVFLASTITFAQNRAKGASKKKEMAFVTESHDYGELEYEANGSYSFKFTNNSKKPLVITNVKSSCGCTVPTWPREPIQPGETGSIQVNYNTKLAGMFNKTVQVFSSAKNSPVRLTIKGKVLPHPATAKTSMGKPGQTDQSGSGLKTADNKTELLVHDTEGRVLSKDRQARKEAYLKKMAEARKKKK